MRGIVGDYNCAADATDPAIDSSRYFSGLGSTGLNAVRFESNCTALITAVTSELNVVYKTWHRHSTDSTASFKKRLFSSFISFISLLPTNVAMLTVQALSTF